MHHTQYPTQQSVRQRTPLGVLIAVFVVAVLVAGGLAIWLLSSQDELDRQAGTGFDTAEVDEQDSTLALELLTQLRVDERDLSTPYDRREFGEGWVDLDADGCTPRNEILARDLEHVTYQEGTDDCVVETGVLQDPFSGRRVEFQRGPDTSAQVQIDHVVSLSDAWQKGAQYLSYDQRVLFANDPMNLVAVTAATNQGKSNLDASEWLPAQESAHCRFAATQTSVKAKYGLWVTPEEYDTLEEILVSCADQPALSSN